MELSGYPHYENVCSNILAFYLDPASPHGLGSLCLDALLEAARCDTFGSPLSSIVVEREMQTTSGKSLDILVESDSLLLAIENKIFAGLNNPLSDYADLVNERKADRREVLKLVLSLAPPSPEPSHGFRSLLYKDFTTVLRTKLGHYACRADSRYLIYFVDFLDTIDDLQRGTQMDAAWLDFARDNREDVQALLKQAKTFKSELRRKVQELRSMIEVGQMPKVRKQFLYREADDLSDCLAHEITVDTIPGVTVVDAVVSAKGWEIIMNVRPRQAPPALRKLLDSLSIPYLDRGDQLIYPEHIPYSTPISAVRSHVQPIIEKIANASRSTQPGSAL